jgi:CheY-like chemotaxis protein
MPVMDGLEAAIKIHELDQNIPVVAMTANIMANDLAIYKENGMKDCIGKPFTSQELWHCLLKYFNPVNWHKEDLIMQRQSDDELNEKLKSSFLKNNQCKFDEIIDAMNAGDIKLAYRLVHTLKSNAGQLKKTKLQQIAKEVEHNLKNEENNVTPEQMETLKTELDKTLTELKAQISTSDGSQPPAGTLNSEAARELLKELLPMLEESNPECMEYINRLRLIPGSEELIQQIENFNFEQALALAVALNK